MALQRSRAGRVDPLRVTDRQAQILWLIGEGLSDRAVADELGCSYRTVRTHLERLYRSTGVHSRAAAVAAWLRSGDPAA